MKAALQIIAFLLEFLIQAKRRSDDEDKKKRVDAAKSDPINYLRQFGRVQHDGNDSSQQSAQTLPDKQAKVDKHQS